MATLSVTDFASFIKTQIKVQEQIETCLSELESLIAAAVMTDNFYTLSNRILHNYFSVVGDLIGEATKANQTSLDTLLKYG